MATTNFVDGITKIPADWANDVDAVVYGDSPVSKIEVTVDNVDINYSVPFASTGSGSAELYSDTSLVYNPSENTIITGFVFASALPTSPGHLTRKDYVDDKIAGLNTVIFEIGAWDMSTTTSPVASIPHSLTRSKIREVTALIVDDAESESIDFFSGVESSTSLHALSADATNAVIIRGAAGVFDSAAFSSVLINRGWITIKYAD